MDKINYKSKNEQKKLDDYWNVEKNEDIVIPIELRRKKGKFFTKKTISEYTANIIWNIIKPNIIFEPFVGEGSLITPLLKKGIESIVNDIDKMHIDLLKIKYKGLPCSFKSQDFITTPMKELFEDWHLPIEEENNFLIYSNPPYGTSSTNRLIMKDIEKKESLARKIEINYYDLSDKYGRGDLVLPSIGKMIEVIKKLGKGNLAFFCPFGIFCERYRYKKLLMQLLKNFKFCYGELFSGENFDDVSKDKPIAFSIWQYHPNINSNHENIKFIWNKKELEFKRMILLKDGWRYDTRKPIRGEIGVQGNDRFNSPVPKIFHLLIEKGGSELIPENVKIPLNIENIPDELFYGLWSITIGNRAIIKHPLFIDNAYTHLPNLKKHETYEILAYALIYAIIIELKHNYTGGRIGFIGINRRFKFGGDRLTMGAKNLIENYGKCPVGNSNIKKVYETLKKTDRINHLSNFFRSNIINEIKIRLKNIGYWDYIPLPKKQFFEV